MRAGKSVVALGCAGVAVSLLVASLHSPRADDVRQSSVSSPSTSASGVTSEQTTTSSIATTVADKQVEAVDLGKPGEPSSSLLVQPSGDPLAEPAAQQANDVQARPTSTGPALPMSPAEVPAPAELVTSPQPSAGAGPPVGAEVPTGAFGVEEIAAPEPVAPLPELQQADTEAWRNDDGSVTVTTYALPRFFQPADSEGGWQLIDTSLVPDADNPGRFRSAANEWEVSFGPTGSELGFQRFELDDGISFVVEPVEALASSPTADGSSVKFAEVWPSTDVEYLVSAMGVDERIVLRSARGPASFTFHVDGALPVLNQAGGVDLLAGDKVVGVIPPLTVETATDWIHPASVEGRFDVTAEGLGGSVRVNVDSEWLAGLPPEAFPVVIDPTVFPVRNATVMKSLSSAYGELNSLRFGVDAGTIWRAKASVPIPDPALLRPGGTQPWRLVTASLRLIGGGGQLQGLTVYGQPLEPLQFRSIGDEGTPQMTYLSESPFADVTDWVRGRRDVAWYGFKSNCEDPQRCGGGYLTNVQVDYRFYQSTDPTVLESPVGTVSTTTPLLVARATNYDPTLDSANAVPYYNFRVSTDEAGTGSILESGWTTKRSWQVPAGALADGMTYYVRVQTSIGAPWCTACTLYFPPAAAEVRSFTIKKRLGSGGPSPTDTVGSVPGSTVTPSEGAPSPGVAPASVTVNLTTGNLALVMNTRALPALGGAAGVTLNYDSLGSSGLEGRGRGLYGMYWSGSGTSALKIGERLDSSINFSWPGSPMGGYAAPGPMTAEWTGTITVPATSGRWRLGGVIGSGTLTIRINGAVYANLSASSSPVFGPDLPLTPGGANEIRITYVSNGARVVQLWAQDSGVAVGTAGREFVVPSGWLTPRAAGLPLGWRMSANPFSGSWTRLDDRGSQVVISASSGATATFTRRSDGTYAPPPGVTDLLTPVTATWAGPAGFAAGEFILSSNEGTEFVFGVDGWVRLVRTLTDDRRPTALRYTYEAVLGTVGAPVLTEIEDPVGQRKVRLCYGSTACDGSGVSTNAPPGMLARIAHWDGTFSWLVYDSSGRLVRLINPGNVVADLGYDASGRLASIRDALAFDAISAGVRPDCSESGSTQCSTVVTYNDAGKVGTITQPAPSSGAVRTQRTYLYPTADTATVQVSGFNPASGFATWVKWDAQGRIVEQKDSMNRLTVTKWDPTIERVLSTVDPAGLQTTNLYDPVTGFLIDVYGPAPRGCFATSAPFTPAGSCAVPVPRTQHRYDEGTTGLAATFWDNPYFAGAPVKHQTGPGGTGPSGPGCTANTLCTQWNELPVAPSGSKLRSEYQLDHEFTWSMRLTGVINAPRPFTISTATTQQVTIYLNGAHYTTVNPATANREYISRFGEWTLGGSGRSMPAGRYEIRIDFLGASNGTLNGLWFTSDPSLGPFLPNSALTPAYGNRTTTIDPDGITSSSSYSGGGIDPILGLATSVTQDPSGLALTSTNTYETVAASPWFRKTASTLPSGTVTSYSHYCSTPAGSDCTIGFRGAVATACGVTQGASQHGLLAQQRDPNPAAGAARVQQFLYDPLGRQVGRRVGTTGAWECTTFDSRGRVTSRAWPAVGTKPARTMTYTFGVGGNPLVNSVSDPNGTITSTVDLLGRITSYTDALGLTTLTTYDQAGRVASSRTTSTATVVSNTYEANSGQLSTVKVSVNGTERVSAAATYDPATGRVSGVSYQGGRMTASYGYDTYGRASGVWFSNPYGGEPNRITGHSVTRSTAGRIIDEHVDVGGWEMFDPNPAGANFVYDGVGRLSSAWLAVGGRAEYGYSVASACSAVTGSVAGAGQNTNRVSVTGAGAPSGGNISCFDAADRLIATFAGGVRTNAYTYDVRGNQVVDGVDSYNWDSADRLAGVVTPGGTVSYVRDPLDRLVRRTDKGVVTQYAYRGLGDVPVAVYDGARNLVQQFVYLPGGVSVTLDATATSRTWSFPNLHGHVTATSNDNGDRLTSTLYDPWGVALNPAPNNVTGTADLAGYGGNGKLTESTTTKPVTHMGARPFTASTARFLTVDPIHGGCANHYVYGFGDPLNGQDLTGKAESPIVSCWAFMVHQSHVTFIGGIYNGVFSVAAVFDDANATFMASDIYLDYSPAPFGLPRHLGTVSDFAGLTMMMNLVGAAVFSRADMDSFDFGLSAGGNMNGIGLVGPFGVSRGSGGATSIKFRISLITESPNHIAGYYNHWGNFTCKM